MKNFKYYKIEYEDDDVIGLTKNAGLLSIPDRYRKDIPNLRAMLTEKYGEIFVVHRLDQFTSGAMIFAKNAEAHSILNQQFDNLEVKKTYIAVVSGVLDDEETDIDIPLLADPYHLGQTIPSARGKASLTQLKVIERFRMATFVEVNLVTGRHHQIRVHCASIGHPLLVDNVYGKNSEFYLSTIKKRFNVKKDEEELPIISRLTMHSRSLTFKHPSKDEMLTVNSEEPKDLQALIQVLRKYSGLPH